MFLGVFRKVSVSASVDSYRREETIRAALYYWPLIHPFTHSHRTQEAIWVSVFNLSLIWYADNRSMGPVEAQQYLFDS